MMRSILNLTSATLLAAVFLLAAVGKLHSRQAFRDFAQTTTVLVGLRAGWAAPAALGTVIAEVATALLLLPTPTRRFGLVAAGVLLVAFTVTLVRAVRSRRRVSCNCFGVSATPVNATHLVRNLLLLVVVGIGLATGLPDVPPVRPLDLMVSGSIGAICAVLVSRWDDLVSLFGGPGRPG